MSQATLGEAPYVNSDLFSSHYLDTRVRDLDGWDCDAAAREAFERIQRLWDGERNLVETYNEDQLLDHWIDEVLAILGHARTDELSLPDAGGFVDRLLFASTDDRRDAAALQSDGRQRGAFAKGSAVVEAKRWDHPFDRQFGEARQYRDASHQVKHYLERTPDDLAWGVLTNGRKWRLYGTRDYETRTYYEVDLPELLERGDLEAFKYFYVFFRSEAFRGAPGSSFLDTVWSESETAAQELGEDLQDNVFTALRVLGKGFVETNDLDIDPDDEARLAELKEQSLVLLYRLMFVLYAESRGLIHPEAPGAREEYDANFSLDRERREVIDRVGETLDFDDEFSRYSTTIWQRLRDLFALVDEGNDDLGIPPYDGGLFDPEAHAFLEEHAVSNRHVAEVIFRLSTVESDGAFVAADYADLDTRHLGSIYEGLLEHEFRVAPTDYAAVAEDGGQVWKPADEVTVADAVETVAAGGLYVVNDEGERKATGAYYTPDYVVTYIVEETVDPLVEGIETDLADRGLDPGTEAYVYAFADEVLDLKILDPAMGSGHFLTRATGYLADRVMERVRDLETGRLFSEQQVRRNVAKECIYGVDLNGMAVELAKLSMWLETLAADKPLAFLDHHLKTGNSLVGSDITEVLSEDNGDGQLTLTQAFARARERTLGHVMDLMQDLLAIDNDDLDDIRSMKALYDEIRADPLYRRLFELANVHTAERFGASVPADAYERMAGAIEHEDEWNEIRETDWFRAAQATADEEAFFHWELEFPEAFFDADGRKREGAGFDAVVGNPPYVKIQNLRKTVPAFADYAVETFETATGRFDIYALFVEQGSALGANSRVSYILPNKFFESGAGEPLRGFLTERGILSEIIDFGQHQVFEGVTTYTCILSLAAGGETFGYAEVEAADEKQLVDAERVEMEIDDLGDDKWALTGPKERRVLDKLRDGGTPIGEQTEYLSEGIVSGDNEVLFVEVISESGDLMEIECSADGERYHVEPDLVEPLVDGDEIERFGGLETDDAVVYPYEVRDGRTVPIPEETLRRDYPMTHEYLSQFEERLSDRGTEDMRYRTWYALYRPREKRLFESPKLVVPDVCQGCEFTSDDAGGTYLPNSAYGIVLEHDSELAHDYILAILNSTPTWFYIYHTGTILRGDYRRFMTSYLTSMPIPGRLPEAARRETPSEYERVVEDSGAEHSPERRLADAARVALNLHERRADLSLDLLPYLGTYSDGPRLPDAGFYQPAADPDSVLHDTTEDRDSLRVGRVEVERENPNSVLVKATARYKPENDDAHETDRWGYTETDPLPAFRLTDLTAAEADLVEAFVPVAVETGDGFAGFRDNATKTNSPMDRVEAVTLPAVDDVRDGLERYLDAAERAAELDGKIARTDALIDEIVYDLYGLTEEEREIVEAAVGD